MAVSAAWPGATTDEMQRQVADPLEKRLQELVYYDRVETTVRPGLMLMKVYLQGQHAAGQAPVGVLPGPQEAVRPGLQPAARRDGAAVQRRVLGRLLRALRRSRRKGLPHRQLVLRAEDLRQRLLRVPGVEKINILGEQAQKIFVEISYQRLATLGITGQQLLAALANQNDVTPAGFVEAGGPARVPAPRRRHRRPRRDPQPAGGGGRPQPQARRHRRGEARLRGPEDLRDPQRRRAGPDARPRDEARLQRPHARRGARTPRRWRSTTSCRSASPSPRSPTRPRSSTTPSTSSW